MRGLARGGGALVEALLAEAPPEWLVDAEASVPCGGPGQPAVSFFFEDPRLFDAFAERLPGGAALREHERVVRERFLVVPRRWVKVGAGLSQYFQVDPSLPNPITTLRVFLRQYGVADVTHIAALLRPALAEESAIWALVLKHRDGAATPRLSARLPRAAAHAVLDAFTELGHLERGVAAAHRARIAAMPGPDITLVSFEPGVPGSCALDFEDVPASAVPGAAAALPGVTTLSYAKCRLDAGGAAQWTAYLPLERWRAIAPRL